MGGLGDIFEERDGRGRIAAAVRSLGIADVEHVADQLWRFHGLLREADATLNLTRLRSFSSMLEKHYVDSLLPATMFAFRGRVMDLGSGGGFPGIPLAIALPQVQFLLVEGRRKRTAFLESAVSALGLTNVAVVARKVNPNDNLAVDQVVVRAVARSEELLDRVAGSVAVGGEVVLLKGPECDDEIAAVRDGALPFSLETDRAYRLPRSGDARRLLVFRRLPGPWPLAAGDGRGGDVEGDDGEEHHVSIVSANNDRFRHWRQLLTGRGARKHGETLLCGGRYVREALDEVPGSVLGVLSGTDGVMPALPDGVAGYRLAPALLRELDGEGTGGPIAWLRVPEMPPWQPEALRGVALVLAMQNPDNVGAAIRSAEALGADEVVLLEGAASPFQPKALRASGPAAFRLPLRRGPSLAGLHEARVPVVALEAGGTPIQALAVRAPLALLVGREGPGLEGLDRAVPRVGIPMTGRAESLNATVAVSIALYELLRER